MKVLHVFCLSLTACSISTLAACRSAPATAPALESGARLYEGLGEYQRPIRTAVPQVQVWFDQGLAFVYGFNHDEAVRSFGQAARLDPDCAMAWWGVAYAHGLHINNPEMSAESSRLAHEAAQRALRCSDGAAPAEQALVRAVAARYAWPVPEDRAELDRAYADAMEAAWRAHPEDPDVGALFAESLMNLQPWDYWTHEGEPKGRILEIVAALEAVLAARPDHPGANHFYIHAVEASLDPGRAEAAADRLAQLVPGAGHLVHMPAHIYVRVGRWADAAESNERAIAADRAYFALAPPPGFYNIYYMHDVHFLAYAAMMEGRSGRALEAARKLEADVPRDFLREHVAIADAFMATPLHVLMRFGRWEEILEEPASEDFQLLTRALRHHARGVALANLDRTRDARAELAEFDAAAQRVPEDWSVGNNGAHAVLAIARHMLLGEIAFKEGNADDAFEALREAVRLEDALVYDEPPGWLQPVRHALGALLVAAGRHAEAEEVYRADLERHPNNGWAILGLQQALRGLGRTGEAAALEPRLAAAFARADVRPHASCYCHPGA